MFRFFTKCIPFLVVTMIAVSATAKKRDPEPTFSMTFNPVETAAFITAKYIIKAHDLTYVPLHFDAYIRFNDWIGLAMGLVYRYENYGDSGPLHSNRGNVRETSIWSNYHDIYLLAGPRFSPLSTGLDGFFISVKAGIGTGVSPNYFSLVALAQPDIGYAFHFGTPGFTLTLSAGALFQMPFYETVPFAVPWNSTEKFTTIGVLVHQITPILNVGLGFNL